MPDKISHYTIEPGVGEFVLVQHGTYGRESVLEGETFRRMLEYLVGGRLLRRNTVTIKLTDLPRQKVKIEMGYGHYRNITRTVHSARLTGYTTKGWMGTEFHQWKGFINYGGRTESVWGYTTLNDGNPPEEWANDTY